MAHLPSTATPAARRAPRVAVITLAIQALLYPTLFELSAQSLEWQVTKNGGFVNGNTEVGSETPLGGQAEMVLDNSGNIYLAATADRGSSDSFLTLSYDSQGQLRWARLKEEADRATAIAAGANGQIVVVGRVSSANGSYDALTVAYDQAGNELWSRTKNGPLSATSASSSVAIGPTGTVFVATTVQENSLLSAMIFAYDSAGNELWARTVGPTGVSILAASANGLVFLARMSGTGVNLNMSTLAFDSAGNDVWSRTKEINGAEVPTDIKADALGRVILVGRSTSQPIPQGFALAYDSKGNELWFRAAPGAHHALALGSGGLVAVAGSTADFGDSTSNFQTIVYDMTGIELWSRQKNGAANQSDAAFAAAFGPTGLVFVTGVANRGDQGPAQVYMTVAYDGLGTELWSQSSAGPHLATTLAVSASGIVFVSGNAFVSIRDGHDALTLAYSSTGDPLWTATEPPLRGYVDDFIEAAIDGAGNLYLTGSRYRHVSISHYGSDIDFMTVALDPSGAERWTRFKGGPANLGDKAEAITVASNGNVYVAGQTFNGTNLDFLIVAYDQLGNELWSQVKDLGFDETVIDLLVDAFGNVYVVGSTGDVQTSSIHAVAYDSLGVELWSKTALGVSGNAFAKAAAFDSQRGRLIVGGSAGLAVDFLAVAWDSAGQQLWLTSPIGGPGRDEPAAIDVGNDGEVFMTGGLQIPSMPRFDNLTVAFDGATGATLWSRTRVLADPASLTAARDLKVANDQVVILARTPFPSSRSQVFSYDVVTGNDRFTQERQTSDAEYPVELIIGPDGNLYVLTQETPANLFDRAGVVAFDPSGRQIWQWSSANSSSPVIPRSLKVDGNGIYIGSYTFKYAADFKAIKLAHWFFADGFESGDLSGWTSSSP